MWTALLSFIHKTWDAWKAIPASTRWLILGCVLCIAVGAGLATGYYKPKLDTASASAEYYKQRATASDGYIRAELEQIALDNQRLGAELEQYRSNNANAIRILETASAIASNGLNDALGYSTIAEQNKRLYSEARQIIAALGDAYRALTANTSQ